MVTHVGDYFLGHERVSLFCDPEHFGGYFSLFTGDHLKSIHAKDTKHGKILVGFGNCNRWREVLEILMHEVHEYAYARMGTRLMPDDKDNEDSAAYVFVMTHAQFTQATQWASWFLCPAMPDLCSAWRKSIKRKRKR